MGGMAPAPKELPARALTDGTTTPKHQQLREILYDWCTQSLSPGDMLPGERVLEEHFGVSRITVRRAIGDLVASGKLARRRGKGTFVADSEIMGAHDAASFQSFTAEMRAQGLTPSSTVLEAKLAVPPPEVAAFFGVSEHTEQVYLKRLRFGSGTRFALDAAWFNAALAQGLLDHPLEGSIYELLAQEYHLPITSAQQVITAVVASAQDAAQLEVPPRAALLKVARTSLSGTSPVEWCVSLFRTDVYAMRTNFRAA